MPTAIRPTILAALACAAVLSSGCAAGAMQRAQTAERLEDYDLAVVEYTQLVREHPDDAALRTALNRASLRASQQHFATGRRLAAGGRFSDALAELQLASDLNPLSGELADAVQDVRRQMQTRVAVDRDNRTELEILIERTRDLPPQGLELPADLTLPDSLVFRDASSRDIFTALARFANLSLVFDPSFQDAVVDVDLRNVTFQNALGSLTATTQTFYKVTAPMTVTIVPDTPAKRREYEEEILRTFFLSNADLEETIDLLRVVVDLRRVAPVSAANAIAVQDTPERVAAASKLLAAIDKARPEVVIDVELLEVDRTRLQEYGLQLASPGSAGIAGVADINRGDLTLNDVVNLGQSDIFLGAVPGLYYRLLKRDSSTRVLANPQLRTSEGIAAEAAFGEEIPVPVTTFQPIATGGVNQQPITSFNYRNIGVNLAITPRTHHDNEVTLAVTLEVTSISGSGFGDLPTFGNREVTTTIRLRDGETNMLAGLIRDDERRAVEGVPGLSDIPFIGRLFAYNRTETKETDILLTLTPHIVRVLDLTEADLRAFALGSSGGTGVESAADDVPPGLTPRPLAAPPLDDDEAEPALIRPITPPAPSAPDVDESEQ